MSPNEPPNVASMSTRDTPRMNSDDGSVSDASESLTSDRRAFKVNPLSSAVSFNEPLSSTCVSGQRLLRLRNMVPIHLG
jgi:hypothetical protein